MGLRDEELAARGNLGAERAVNHFRPRHSRAQSKAMIGFAMSCRQRLGPVSLFLLAGSLTAAGQELKEGNAADAPRLSPGEQQTAFTLAEGFTIELVTSEIQGTEKPVALHFDTAGRLWTQTATEYPLDLNDPQHAGAARQKWKDGGRDKVLVIEAPLGPGPHTPRIFAEGLVMPMSVLPFGDGALVAHGPEMLRLRDTDGDGRADRRDVLLKGFGVQDSHTMAHQMMWLPDGSVLVIQGVLDSGGVTDASGRTTAFNFGKFASFRPDGTGFRLLGAGLNNTWGVFLTRTGRLWVQEANSFDHCIAPFEEGVHYHGWNAEPYIKGAPWQPGVGQVDLGSTGLSGLAQSEDRAGGFPPEWQRRLLIANAVTGTINSVTADPQPDGGWKVTRGPDLVTCRDRRFRPVHLAFGPDACLYIVDWYNPVISHNEVARDHPARDKTSGRIWRVRHATQTRRSAPDVRAAPEAALISHLQSPVTWEMRAAWREIVDRPAPSLIPQLSALAGAPSTPEDIRIHALWCLAGLGHFQASTWADALASGGEDTAVELVRALRSLRPQAGEVSGFLKAVAARPERRVQREVARYFQEASEIDLPALALALQSHRAPLGDTLQGVQGETLSWPAYDQAFLNSQLDRILELQPAAVDALAVQPGLLEGLPPAVRVQIEQRRYRQRFEDGSFTAADLGTAAIRSAALACADSSEAAARLLRQHGDATAEPLVFAAECLNHETLTPAALRRFAGPLALRLMQSEDAAARAGGLDLAALACTEADSTAFISRAARLLQSAPNLLTHAVRAATAAGIRDAAWYASLTHAAEAPVAARAAAWPGWFQSAAAADKPEIEARCRAWIAGLTSPEQTEALDEFASTTVGAHFALNNALPSLLAQDAAVLSRLADELAERVPGHGRLAPIQELVRSHLARRTAERSARVEALETALAAGSLAGNPSAGRPLFSGLCLTCHSAGGQGVGFAPPLDGSAQRHRAALLTALIDPEAAVENVFRPFQVRLRDGSRLEGFLKARAGNRISLQAMGGAVTELNSLRVHSARHLNGVSLMPPLAATLADQQIADLVAYALSLR